jgi:hypothetical protein
MSTAADRDARAGGGRAGPWIEAAAVAALAAVLAAALIGADRRRPFDIDEVLTYYASQASGPAELGEVLSSGGFDASPPLYIIAVWQAQRFVRDVHLAYRLPATLGFVAFCLGLYAFARRRCPPAYAAIAMLAPAASPAVGLAMFARPYGLMLGFIGLALACWRAATEGGRRRPAALVGLAASLAAAVATHYYAILLLAPLAAAELARRRGRPDLPVWIALAFAFAPLPLLRPQMAHALALARGASWLPLGAGPMMGTYAVTLTPLLPFLAAIGALLLLDRSTALPGRGGEPVREGERYPAADVALILGLLCLPALGLALGLAVTKAYSTRYVIPYVGGLALLSAYLAAVFFRGRPAFGVILAGVLLWSFRGIVRNELAGDWSWRDAAARSAARAAEAGRQLVVPSDDFLIYHFYASPETRGRMTLVDFDDAKHARLIEDLRLWMSRKGLGDFEMKGLDYYLDHPGEFFTYAELDRVTARCSRPVTIELLGGTADRNSFFAIVPGPAGGGSRTP